MDTIKELDALEAIDRAIDEGLDIWELAINIAAQDESEMAERRWRQGDLALRVEKHYGEDAITKFASAINVPTSTVKQRRQMSAFYQKDTRYLFENLGYTHYRTAMKLDGRALWALEKASAKDWPSWKFELLVKRLQGKTAKDVPIEGVISYVSAGQIIISVPEQSAFLPGQHVQLKVKSS